MTRTSLLFVLLASSALAQTSFLRPVAPRGLTADQIRYLDAARETVGVLSERLVVLSPGVLAAPEVALHVPGLVSVVLSATDRGSDAEVWTGRGSDARAMLVVRDGQATGAVHDGPRTFALRPLGSGLHVLLEIDPLRAAMRLRDDALTMGGAAEVSAAPGAPVGGSVLDVLVVFTPQALAAHADPVALSEFMVRQTNEYYDLSGIPIEARLVGVHYTPTTGGHDDLPALLGLDDGRFDEVHDVRDQVGADVVSMIVPSSAPYCGQGVFNASDKYAFSVVASNCTSTGRTFAHEIGHNMGAHHDTYSGNNTAFAHGHGAVDTDARWFTIMSYAHECNAAGVACSTVPYFSTPNRTYNGEPLGDATTRDNVRVHVERAATVAAFRNALPVPTATVTPTPLSVEVPTGSQTLATVSISNMSEGRGLWWSVALDGIAASSAARGDLTYTVSTSTMPAVLRSTGSTSPHGALNEACSSCSTPPPPRPGPAGCSATP